MKTKLLAATAAVLLLAAPAIAQDSGGTDSGGTGANAGTADSSTTQLPAAGSADTTQGTGTDTNTAAGTGNNTSDSSQNTGVNAQTDTTTSGQTGTDAGTGTDANSNTATTSTATTGTNTSVAETADNQQVMQQLSQVKAAPEFVNFAAMSDLFEKQSGEFASDIVKGKMAKELAQMIIKDHAKSSREMMGIVKTAALNVQPPTELNQRHQQLIDELKSAAEEPGATTSSTSSANNSNTASSSASDSGTAAGNGVVNADGQMTLDQIFARQQVQAHEEGIALFQAYSQNGDNPELKSFAEKGLPALKEHLKMAQDLVKAQDELMQKSQTQQ